ncbi:MAG: isochorismatase family protein [Azospirillum sp.]|nr:isochorismatase family protein [Azospirillum sp.]
MLLDADRSLLVIIDLQERLLPAIHDRARVIANTRVLLQAAAALGVPVIATEQYPKGLGRTVAELLELLPAPPPIAKLHFACTGEPAFAAALAASGRDQIVLAGTEAHVCVLQTALGLRQLDRTCFVVADAVSSRTPDNAELGLKRMAANGVELVSTEMTLFEWMGRAGTPAFKAVSRLIK